MQLTESVVTPAASPPREKPAPAAPVRLRGRMTPKGYRSENADWLPFLTYATKQRRHDGTPRRAGRDPMTLSLDVLTKAGHPKRSMKAILRAYGEGAEGVRTLRDVVDHCNECAGGNTARRKCAVINCPFWLVRTGRNPYSRHTNG
jgi:hypothetical protein